MMLACPRDAGCNRYHNMQYRDAMRGALKYDLLGNMYNDPGLVVADSYWANTDKTSPSLLSSLKESMFISILELSTFSSPCHSVTRKVKC